MARSKAEYDQKLAQTESQLASARKQMEQLQHESEIRLSEIRMELLDKAASERERMKRGAETINRGVADLRARLNRVDESIFRAARDLENATQPIYDALSEAETNAHHLQGQMQRFPYSRTEAPGEAKPAAPVPGKPAAPAKPAEPREKPAARPAKQPETLDPKQSAAEQKHEMNHRVESILERLNRILGDS